MAPAHAPMQLSLNAVDRREACRCTVVVKSRLNAVRPDGDAVPSCPITDARLAKQRAFRTLISESS
jgi:hypothetical protein